jgi:regulatory protein
MPGTITALEVQKRNKERVNVYLDGEYAFSLVMIEAARLRKGQTLSAEEIASLQARDAVEHNVDRAVRFLSYRPRSISEIRRNLAQKDVPDSVIDEVIMRLENLGYVDDLAFARFWVENRDEFKPRGPLALRQELRQKGIANKLIEQVLADVDFFDAAYRAAHKKIPRWRGLNRLTFKQKLYPYLARQGFQSGTIQDVIDRLLEELDLPEPNDSDNDGL